MSQHCGGETGKQHWSLNIRPLKYRHKDKNRQYQFEFRALTETANHKIILTGSSISKGKVGKYAIGNDAGKHACNCGQPAVSPPQPPSSKGQNQASQALGD
nr:hypothetical protein [Bowmanella yangjiangensis]